MDRIEGLLFASDFATFQKIDALIASGMGHAQSAYGMSTGFACSQDMGFFTDGVKEFHLTFVPAFPDGKDPSVQSDKGSMDYKIDMSDKGSMHDKKDKVGIDDTSSVDKHAGKHDKSNMNDKHGLSGENDMGDEEGVDGTNNPDDKIDVTYMNGMDDMDDTDEKIGMNATSDLGEKSGMISNSVTDGKDTNDMEDKAGEPARLEAIEAMLERQAARFEVATTRVYARMLDDKFGLVSTVDVRMDPNG